MRVEILSSVLKVKKHAQADGMTCQKSHSKGTIELRLKPYHLGHRGRAGIAHFFPPILNCGQEGGDSPEDEWGLALGIVFPSHLASNDGAPMKCQAFGRGLQTLGSWSARLGLEGLLRPGSYPAPTCLGAELGGRGGHGLVPTMLLLDGSRPQEHWGSYAEGLP